jgi:hypothetical protein
MNNTTIVTHEIPISRGIFQGDSLSPLWFCLALNPLSKLLNNTKMGFDLKYGHREKQTVNHLFYMDDLKLYAANRTQLSSLLEAVATFSSDINMNLGLDKCAILDIIKGKPSDPKALDLMFNNLSIQSLQTGDTYKYLGFLQSLTKTDKEIKSQLQSKLIQRVKHILNTELNSKNKIKAINSWSIPAMTYSFGMINWSETDLEALNRQIRTLLTKHRMHHPKAAIERLYLSRKQGGRGLLDLSTLCKRQIKTLKTYFINKAPISKLHHAITKSDTNYTPLNMSKPEIFPTIKGTEDRKQAWRQKELHGRYPHSLDTAKIDASVRWLRDGHLFGETEGFMIAIQDHVIRTKNHQKFIEKLPSENDLCRVCNRYSETIEHITTGCPNLANTEYLHRHNLTPAIVHQQLAKYYYFITEIVPYYEYKPKTVLENSDMKLYWDREIITDQTINCNRPDIVLI